MANNLIQIRRTSVAGREANTETLPNAGELALNILDGRMFSTNGEVVFEIGANTKNSRVSQTLYVGNDSVNVTANSTQINASVIQLSTATYVGANVDITTTGIFVGNTSVNTTITSSELAIDISATANLTANSTLVQVANSTGTANLQPTQLVIGTSVVNTTVVAAGANAILETGRLYVGNSTVNATANSIEIVLANSTVSWTISKPSEAQVSAGNYYLGANGTWLEETGGSGEPGGSNTYVQYNDSTAFGGSAGFTFDEATNNVLIANTLTIDTATINSTNYTGTANNALYLGGTAAASYALDTDLDAYQTEAGLAANVAVLPANSATYVLANNGIVSNSSGVWVDGANGISVDSAGVNVLGNTGTVVNSSGVFVNSAYIGTLSANNAAYLGGTAAADYQTEAGLADNVATLTANNATYFNTHADTYFANVTSPSISTSVSVGANVQLTTSTILVGNSTANLLANSIIVKVANSTGTSNLQPTQLVIGASVVNATAVTANNIYANGSIGSNGYQLTSNGTICYWRDSVNDRTSSITFLIDGGGSEITTGVKGYIEIPFTCAIDRATCLADQAGNVVIDVWKDTYTNYPPTAADKISADAPITLSSAAKSQDSTLTGWTKNITAGDILAFSVNSAATVTRLTLSLRTLK